MCHICTVFTKKTFFFTISGQKCSKGREGSSFRGLFEIFFYESRNDDRAILITKVFVLKLES